MKFSYASVLAALGLAAALSACGGKAQFVVQGTVDNLKTGGLVLANGSDTVSVPAGATSFAFPQQISYGTTYNIVVQKQPDHMTCQVIAGNDSAGHTVTIVANVTCAQNTYSLGGKFVGLTNAADATARTVTLLNGSTGGSLIISSTADGTGEFQFASPVADGQAYGVTVQTQPTGLTCTLQNATGVMQDSLVSNVVLTCAP